MTGTTEAVQAVSAPPLNWPQKAGRLLGAMDEIAAMANAAALVHTEPEVLRTRLREVATVADQAAAACK
jgi:hypothetical protein